MFNNNNNKCTIIKWFQLNYFPGWREFTRKKQWIIFSVSQQKNINLNTNTTYLCIKIKSSFNSMCLIQCSYTQTWIRCIIIKLTSCEKTSVINPSTVKYTSQILQSLWQNDAKLACQFLKYFVINHVWTL